MNSDENGGIKLFRQRLIPKEIVYLKDDIILYQEPEILITGWETLKPKADFKYGFSCYYIYEGYKISRVYTADKKYLYTYCDIISSDVISNVYIFLDMLVDIVIKPNGYVQVLDLDELSLACEKKLITVSALLLTLNKADRLLKTIYAGKLPRVTAKLDECIGKGLM
jgi:hypothetical protein